LLAYISILHLSSLNKGTYPFKMDNKKIKTASEEKLSKFLICRKWLDWEWWNNRIHYYFWRVLAFFAEIIFRIVCFLQGFLDIKTDREGFMNNEKYRTFKSDLMKELAELRPALELTEKLNKEMKELEKNEQRTEDKEDIQD